MLIQNIDLRVGDRTANKDGIVRAGKHEARGPNSGLRWAIHIPQTAHSWIELARQIFRHGLAGANS